jgi:heat shock protein HtpX
MARVGLRILMALVGVSLLVLYAVAAWLAFWVLATFWANRPPLGTTLLLVALLTAVFGYVSYQFGTAKILSSIDAVAVSRTDAPRLYGWVEELTGAMSIQPPTVLVAEMALPNALALGSARNGAVVLDRALFRLLTEEELAAILAHEFAHLESRDSLIQTMAYSAMRTVVGLVTVVSLPLVLFVTGLSRALAWIRGRPAHAAEGAFGRFQRTIQSGVAVVFLALTLLIRAHSRGREFAADDRAAEVTGQPLALASALSKIDRVSDPAWDLLTPLYTQGDEHGSFGELFSTHPSTEARVERLVERAASERVRRVRPR